MSCPVCDHQFSAHETKMFCPDRNVVVSCSMCWTAYGKFIVTEKARTLCVDCYYKTIEEEKDNGS